jgi:serine/threonine-protein kinase
LTTIYKIINEAHTPINELKQLPGWLEYAIEGCLKKDPDGRIKTGGALAEILTKRKVPEKEFKKDLSLETIKFRKEEIDQALSEIMEEQHEEEAVIIAPHEEEKNNLNTAFILETEEDDGPGKKRFILPAMIVLTFLILAAAIGYTVYSRYSGNFTELRQEEGKAETLSDATDAGKRQELTGSSRMEVNPEAVNKGERLSTKNSPIENTGSSLNKRRTPREKDNSQGVTKQAPLIKKQTVAVPNLEGMSIQEASRVLRRMGLKSGVVTRITSTAANYNLVLRQIPKSGRRLNEGSTVNLIVGE